MEKKKNPQTFFIKTLGCKVNLYDSDRLSEELEQKGLEKDTNAENADILIINTCTVTGRAAQQSRQAIRALYRNSRAAFVVVTGCLAQNNPEEIKKIKCVDLVAGNDRKNHLTELILKAIHKNSSEVSEETEGQSLSSEWKITLGNSPVFGKRARPNLKIQDGCNSRCTYCTVPDARGPARSAPGKDIIRHLKKLYSEGYNEVVLTGIHLGFWGKDLVPKESLQDLLGEIAETDNMPLIRLSSIEPLEWTDRLIETVAFSESVQPHFHLPLQSGDDRVLKAMARPYSSGYFEELVMKIREMSPVAAIGVDLLTGFPEEDEEAFLNTFSLIKRLPLTYLHVFPFSPRKNTPAFGFYPRIPHLVKTERARILRETGQKKKMDFYKKMSGGTFRVIVQGPHEKQGMLKGITENYIPVFFSSPPLPRASLLKCRLGEKIVSGMVEAFPIL